MPIRLLRLILLAAILSLGAELFATWLGHSHTSQVSAVLFGMAGDAFGDYFKFILSFPGGEHVSPGSIFGLAQVDIYLPEHNPFVGVDGLSNAAFTHLHGMPLMTLFCLLSLRAMAWVGGAAAFITTYALLVFYWSRIALGWAGNRREGYTWILVGLASYPFVLMVARGNIYAGVTGMLIVHALLLASRRTAPVLAAVLLATAINIRPNAVLLTVPLMLFYLPQIRRVLPAFCLAGGSIVLVSLWLAHALYPDYTLTSLREGLAVYYRGYVVGNAGLAFGSSLYGALKVFLGYRPGLDVAALMPSLAVLALGAFAWCRGRLSDTALLFLAAAAYCLGSSVIGDYHLLVFLVPPMVAMRAWGGWPTTQIDRIAVGASALMLMPKNVLFFAVDLSVQVVLNPLILLGAAAIMLTLAFRSDTAPVLHEAREAA